MRMLRWMSRIPVLVVLLVLTSVGCGGNASRTFIQGGSKSPHWDSSQQAHLKVVMAHSNTRQAGARPQITQGGEPGPVSSSSLGPVSIKDRSVYGSTHSVVVDCRSDRTLSVLLTYQGTKLSLSGRRIVFQFDNGKKYNSTGVKLRNEKTKKFVEDMVGHRTLALWFPGDVANRANFDLRKARRDLQSLVDRCQMPIHDTEGARRVTIASGRANIRTGPDVKLDVLGQATEGLSFLVVGEENDWFKIQYADRTGWVHSGVTLEDQLQGAKLPRSAKNVTADVPPAAGGASPAPAIPQKNALSEADGDNIYQAVANARQRNDKTIAMGAIELQTKWRQDFTPGSSAVLMMADFTIKNKSDHTVNNIRIECKCYRVNEYRVPGVPTVYERPEWAQTRSRTIESWYPGAENFPAHSTRVVQDFGMGIINPEIRKATCEITDLEIVAKVHDPERENIRTIQQLLGSKGYAVGVYDGVLGKKTAVAIRKFQQDVGLPVNGKVSKELRQALESLPE